MKRGGQCERCLGKGKACDELEARLQTVYQQALFQPLDGDATARHLDDYWCNKGKVLAAEKDGSKKIVDLRAMGG
eukprot:scaffold4820_cov28-Tisochrysis_lutea.AAC.2